MKPLWGFQADGTERDSHERSLSPRPDLRGRPLRDPVHGGRGRRPRSRTVADLHRHQHLHPSVARVLGLYGLGTENQNLPGYITIKPALAHGGAKNWSSAFLPGAYQGTAIGHSGLKVKDFRESPSSTWFTAASTPEQQRYELDMLQNINRRHAQLRRHDAELEARIQAFELAFRMQMRAPEAFEVEKRNGGHPEALRPRPGGDARVRMAMPAGAAPGRAGRALHPVHPQLQVGPAFPTLREAHRERPGSGSAHRRTAQGPEVQGHAGGDVGDLGR